MLSAEFSELFTWGE